MTYTEKLLIDNQFETIDEYFGYIVENYIDGDFDQCRDLFTALTIKDAIIFAGTIDDDDQLYTLDESDRRRLLRLCANAIPEGAQDKPLETIIKSITE